MNMKPWLIASCLFLGCSTHYLNKIELIEQLQENGRKVYVKECRNGFCLMKHERAEYVFPGSNRLDSIAKNASKGQNLAWIEFNGLKEIRCRNKSGEKVKVGVDHNSQLLFFDKAGNKTQFYLKTGRIEGETIFGYRSVILRIERQISLEDIDSIEIYSEFKIGRSVENE